MIEFIYDLVSQKLREKNLFSCVDILLDKENHRVAVTLRSWVSLKLPQCAREGKYFEIVKGLDWDGSKRQPIPLLKLDLDHEEPRSDSSVSEVGDDGDSDSERSNVRNKTGNSSCDLADVLLPDTYDSNEGDDKEQKEVNEKRLAMLLKTNLEMDCHWH